MFLSFRASVCSSSQTKRLTRVTWINSSRVSSQSIPEILELGVLRQGRWRNILPSTFDYPLVNNRSSSNSSNKTPWNFPPCGPYQTINRTRGIYVHVFTTSLYCNSSKILDLNEVLRNVYMYILYKSSYVWDLVFHSLYVCNHIKANTHEKEIEWGACLNGRKKTVIKVKNIRKKF